MDHFEVFRKKELLLFCHFQQQKLLLSLCFLRTNFEIAYEISRKRFIFDIYVNPEAVLFCLPFCRFLSAIVRGFF